jgi:hypothetical protein
MEHYDECSLKMLEGQLIEKYPQEGKFVASLVRKGQLYENLEKMGDLPIEIKFASHHGFCRGRGVGIEMAKNRINEIIERRKAMKHTNEVAEQLHQDGLGQAWGVVHELLTAYTERK